MKSEKTSRKDHFPFNLYEIPLKSRHRNFLEEPNYAGKNKPQTADELEDKLEQSVRQIFHILLNYQKLEQSKVYDIINAKSMHHILDAAIKDYDLRSSELVRLFFEMAIIYLKNSPNFESQKEIIEDMANPLSKFFQMLSESLLKNENLEKNIPKKERENLQEFLKASRNEFSKKEYDMLKKFNDELYGKLNEQDVYQRIISKHIQPKDFDRSIFGNSVNVHEIVNRIKKNKERMVELSGESFVREGYMQRLSDVYIHLEPYLCRIKPLKEFDYLLSRAMNSSTYVSNLDKKFIRTELEGKFKDEIYEKYKDKKRNKNVPATHLRHSQKKSVVFVPSKEYEIEKREFFKKHGIDIDDKPDPEIEAETNFALYRFKPSWAFDEKYSLMP